MRLIVATANLDKFREIKFLLKGLKIPLVSLKELRRHFCPQENSKTFLGNAIKKTIGVSRVYKNDLVVGEDSGLVVEYLGQKPGVYSRRYADKNSTYYENNLKLLRELEDVPFKKRRAYFICTLVLMRNGRLLKRIEGRLYGYIHTRAEGKNGFGYDPVFYLPAYKKTVAQLSFKEKNKISHRARAFLKLRQYLKEIQNDCR